MKVLNYFVNLLLSLAVMELAVRLKAQDGFRKTLL